MTIRNDWITWAALGLLVIAVVSVAWLGWIWRRRPARHSPGWLSVPEHRIEWVRLPDTDVTTVDLTRSALYAAFSDMESTGDMARHVGRVRADTVRPGPRA